MASFLIDEDLPRSLAAELAAKGYSAFDVRDAGHSGAPDSRVFEYAQSRGMVLVTADVEFGNLLLYPPSRHLGIILARFPNEVPAIRLRARILEFVATIPSDGWKGKLFVLEPGRVRIREG